MENDGNCRARFIDTFQKIDFNVEHYNIRNVFYRLDCERSNKCELHLPVAMCRQNILLFSTGVASSIWLANTI